MVLHKRIGWCAVLALQAATFSSSAWAGEAVKPSISEVNAALKKSPLDPVLNYMAGLAYESKASVGSDQHEMAKVGYTMALKSDPSFWPAHVQLGFLAMEEKDAVTAQEHFTAAAHIKADEPVIFYSLARAAYCSGDMEVARKAWRRATQLRAPQSADDFTTGAAILRRQGQVDEADAYVARIRQMGRPVPRMAAPGGVPLLLDSSPADVPEPDEQETANMGMVDVIILRRDEGRLSSLGVNLLDSLNLQFGANIVNSSWRMSRNLLTGTTNSRTLDASRQLTVSVPSVTYSLNIANSNGGRSTVQAQQAVLIYDGERSNVQIGSTLTFASSGNLSSTVSTMQDGLILDVSTKFEDKDHVRLTIDASLEDFLPGSGAGSFKESVQKEKTSTRVTAILKFGETILISSGEHSTNVHYEDRTPVVGSIPILGKLFASREKATSDIGVIVLLTLRPRGSYMLPHKNDVERRNFERMRNRLLDQLDTGGDEPSLHRYQPERENISYTLDNPARNGDKAYLDRTGAIGKF